MKPRERVLTTFRRQQADRVPYDISIFNREALRLFIERTGCEDTDAYFGVEKDIAYVSFEETQIDLQQRFLQYHQLPEDLNYYTRDYNPKDKLSPRHYTLIEWGTAFQVGSEAAYDYVVPPASMTATEKLEDIQSYPMPDFTIDYRHKDLEEKVAAIHQNNLAAVAPLMMTVFETAWHIRGFEQLLMDLHQNQDIAACLLDRITETSIFRSHRFAQAGVDILQLGDDVGMNDRMLISLEQWQKWLKPRLAKVAAAAKEVKPDIILFYHSDGFVSPIIEDLIEIGIDVLNPVQPECCDPAKIKYDYGDRLAFWGTVGIQHTLPFGSPKQVKAEVKKRIETIGKNGGLYLSPTHMIAPEVPYENIFALVEAVKQYGRIEC